VRLRTPSFAQIVTRFVTRPETYIPRLLTSRPSTRRTDLIDEANQVRVGRWIVEIITALWLLIASAADTAEARDALRALPVDLLVLGMPPHPGDDNAIFVSKDQVHTPVSAEPPLADPMVRAGSQQGPRA